MAKGLLTKQAKAQRLIEIFGLPQKETAALIKVSDKTVGNWVRKFKWIGKKNSAQREREKAKELVLIQGLTYEAAGKEIGVTGTTIRNWAKDGFWKMGVKFIYPNKPQRRFILTEFVKWVSKDRPDLTVLLEDFSNAYNEYIEHKDT